MIQPKKACPEGLRIRVILGFVLKDSCNPLGCALNDSRNPLDSWSQTAPFEYSDTLLMAFSVKSD